MDEFITAFEKNSLEEIRIFLLQYKSYYFIDLRVFSAPQRGGRESIYFIWHYVTSKLDRKIKGINP